MILNESGENLRDLAIYNMKKAIREFPISLDERGKIPFVSCSAKTSEKSQGFRALLNASKVRIEQS